MPIGGTPESGSQGRRRERAAAANSGRGGSRFLLARRLAAAGQNRGAPAILDGRQSPRRHAMAMLISLSHRDEREITVLPPHPSGRSGLTAKRHSSTPRLTILNEDGHGRAAGRSGCANSGAAQHKADPLPETVSRPVARCIARARGGDEGGVQECRRPNARNFAPAGAPPARARGTECGNLDGAAHSLARWGKGNCFEDKMHRLAKSVWNVRIRGMSKASLAPHDELARRNRDRQRLRAILREGAQSAPGCPADQRYFAALRARVAQCADGPYPGASA